VYHAADNAFPKWREYNLMAGGGAWRGRNEKAGPHFYYHDGKLVADPAPGFAGSHCARNPFKIVNRVTDHPIIKGLPKEWIHAGDELYANLHGPGENMTVLSTAWSDPANRGTGYDEPILMVLTYGKGRIFHTTIGHDLAALNCVDFITTYQRGTEWAATGKVTQKVPADFPLAGQSQHAARVQSTARLDLARRQIPPAGELTACDTRLEPLTQEQMWKVVPQAELLGRNWKASRSTCSHESSTRSPVASPDSGRAQPAV
jgi:hypothetical protein